MASSERHSHRHRFHYLALGSPAIVFLALFWLPWNPIYTGIVALAVGALATIACRPELARTTWLGGLLFLGYYVIFLLGLQWTSPDYIDRVWNHSALSGLHLVGMPIEELAWAVTFGMYWSGVYEHYTWHVASEPQVQAVAS
jgi:Flp pilus assembly protein TadB